MFGKTGLKIAATLAAALFCGAALAHSGATGVVAERMEAMKDIAAEMKRIGAMVRGEKDYDAEKAASAAETIAEHAGNMPALFPEGTHDDPSEALPVIWSEWEDFTRSAEQLEASAEALSGAAIEASSAVEIRPDFAAVGKACSACHQDYRQPD